MSTVQVNRTIREFVRSNYGNLIRSGDAVLNSDAKAWVAELKSDYPAIIRDDANPDDRILKFLSLRRLGEVRLKENLAIAEATGRDECVRRLDSLLKRWRERAEDIIVSASATQLAEIGMVKDALNPIVMIISNFQREGKEVITDSEISDEPREQKMRQYFQFLAQISLIEPVSNGFRYGPLLAQLMEKTNSQEELKNVVLAHIIRNHYSTIKEFFKIWRFEPFVHMDTCYYTPALQAGKMLARNEDSLLSQYELWYGSASSRMRLRPILDELVRVEILEERGSLYYGQEQVWENMMPVEHRLPIEISPLRA